MNFIKGTPMQRAKGTIGKPQFCRTKNTAYLNPNAIESAVYDPDEDLTAIRLPGNSTASIVLKGDVMSEYEERERRQRENGHKDED